MSKTSMPSKETALSVSEAIRERIRDLEDELAHWRALLARCVKDAQVSTPARSLPEERRPPLLG